MKKYITLIVLSIFLINSTKLIAKKNGMLKVSENGHFLVHNDGSKFFPIADTAWEIAWRLNRDDVEKYLQKRKEQKFNTIALVAFPSEEIITNAYGSYPFEIKNGKFDPLKPIVINFSGKYDYWNHLNYIISSAADKGLYVILLPSWGGGVAGSYGSGKPNKEIIFNKKNAYQYANWLSRHLKKYNNIIYMLGGDRSAVYGKFDYRNIFRAMAEGLADGFNDVDNHNGEADYSNILISYHPQKWAPNSSKWFHNDKWLSFNSVQDQPSDQVKAISHDYNLDPVKPTWLFEGGYENRGSGKKVYTDWQIRLQAYQTVFAGGFGYTYGHMDIYNFSSKRNPGEKNIVSKSRKWQKSMTDLGACQMRYMFKLMTLWSDKQFLERIPDQTLIDSDTGKMTGWEGQISSCIQATCGKKGDYAMIYSANGSNIRVKMNLLTGPKMNAYWFNPRNGKWSVKGKEFSEMKPFEKNIPAGKKATVKEFNPPGKAENGNDWVLVLK